MRITEGALRRIIREALLTEAAMTPREAKLRGLEFKIKKRDNYAEIKAYSPGWMTSTSPSFLRTASSRAPRSGPMRSQAMRMSGPNHPCRRRTGDRPVRAPRSSTSCRLSG